MRRDVHRRLWALGWSLVMAACVAACSAGGATPAAISEMEVRDWVQRFEAAAVKMDADAMAPLMADWVRFRIDVSGPDGGEDVLHVGREEYLQSVRDLARFRARLSYRAETARIEIAADGASARVWQTSRERLKVGALVLNSRSSGVSELRRGEHGLVLVHGEGRTVLSL